MVTVTRTTVREIGPCMACSWRQTGDRPAQKAEIVFKVQLNRIELILCPAHKAQLKEQI